MGVLEVVGLVLGIISSSITVWGGVRRLLGPTDTASRNDTVDEIGLSRQNAFLLTPSEDVLALSRSTKTRENLGLFLFAWAAQTMVFWFVLLVLTYVVTTLLYLGFGVNWLGLHTGVFSIAWGAMVRFALVALLGCALVALVVAAIIVAKEAADDARDRSTFPSPPPW